MKELDEETVLGVICVHCRLQTPVAKPKQQLGSGKISAGFLPQISIVRCTKCGGEAPYLVKELLAIKTVSGPRAWAA
jgi:hypothetical protein